MEWAARQLCSAVFVLLMGWVLRAGGRDADGLWAGVLCAADDRPFERSRQIVVPLLLYAAAELCCYGRGAATLLPVRMLSLLYGVLVYVGLYAAVGLLRIAGRVRRAAETGVLLLAVLEMTLLGFALLRDGRCQSPAAQWGGAVAMGAAVLLLLLSARRRSVGNRAAVRHTVRSAR